MRICTDTDFLAYMVGLGCDDPTQVLITFRIEVRVLLTSTSIDASQLRLLSAPHSHCRDGTTSLCSYCVL